MKRPFKCITIYRKEEAGDTDDLKEAQYHLEDYEQYPIILDLDDIQAAEPCFMDRQKVTSLFFKSGGKKWILYPYNKMEEMILQPEKLFAKNN